MYLRQTYIAILVFGVPFPFGQEARFNQAMTHSKDPTSHSAMVLFALGHADASLSFSRLLPEDVAMDATSILALRVLGSLWNQYRIDYKINHGRSLLSIDNGYELRVFTTLIDDLAGWPPLVM